MPTTHRSRSLSATPEDVWAVVSDPHHFPRWWPRVQRMEGVSADSWTKVLSTGKGRSVRADEFLLDDEPLRLRSWMQDLEESPFQRVFREITTEVTLELAGEGTTNVTLRIEERLRGLNRLGGFLARRAAVKLLDEALDGLELACGRR
jgi:carbon monoxide dehydrogenase subunit G